MSLICVCTLHWWIHFVWILRTDVWKEVKHIFCIPFFQTLLKLVVLRYYFSDIFLEKEGNLNGKIFSLAEFLPFKKNHNENYNQVVTLVRFVYFGSCASFSIMSGLIWHTVSNLEFLSGDFDKMLNHKNICPLVQQHSDITGLFFTKLSSKILQNLPYFWIKKSKKNNCHRPPTDSQSKTKRNKQFLFQKRWETTSKTLMKFCLGVLDWYCSDFETLKVVLLIAWSNFF